MKLPHSQPPATRGPQPAATAEGLVLLLALRCGLVTPLLRDLRPALHAQALAVEGDGNLRLRVASATADSWLRASPSVKCGWVEARPNRPFPWLNSVVDQA